jgi:hypothetical protein
VGRALVATTAASTLLLVLAALQLRRLDASLDALERDVTSLKRAEAARARDAGLPASPLLLEHALEVPGRGEVFPAMAAIEAPEYWPVAALRVTNTGAFPVALTISAEIPAWSRRSEESVVLAARETRQLRIQPELLPQAYDNDEIRRATLEVRATGRDGSVLFVQSRPVLIHGGSEIYWGRRFANAQVTARWVTPHDPAVLTLVSRARRHVPRGRMAGYNGGGGRDGAEEHVRAQARAVYSVLQRSGIGYVNSLYVMGEHASEAQRIRLPRETIGLATANCMDVSVAFASAMENLGLQPLLIIVPGHAFAGVRLARGTDRVLYLDLTVLPSGSFEAAVARARSWFAKTRAEEVLAVDVAAARALGIYPLGARSAGAQTASTLSPSPSPSPSTAVALAPPPADDPAESEAAALR